MIFEKDKNKIVVGAKVLLKKQFSQYFHVPPNSYGKMDMYQGKIVTIIRIVNEHRDYIAFEVDSKGWTFSTDYVEKILGKEKINLD